MDSEISERIRISRVICILSLVYVHAPPYFVRFDAYSGVDGFILHFLKSAVGHSSVPLLSIISGYLMTVSMVKGTWPRNMAKKINTLLIPLVIWNALGLFKNIAEGHAPSTAMEFINAVFAITDEPSVTPLYFLRDMFVCSLLYPGFRRAIEASLPMTILVATALAIFQFGGFLFLNSQIPLFFVLGCAFAMRDRTGFNAGFVDRHSGILAAAAVLLMAPLIVLPYLVGQDWGERLPFTLFNITLLANRIGGSILYWTLARILLRSAIRQPVIDLERFIFFIFCFHTFAIGMGWMVIKALGIDPLTDTYVLIFVFWPLIVLALSTLAFRAVSLMGEPVVALLLGGRAPIRKAPR